MILAIDTSTRQAGVALLESERVRAEMAWTAAGNHSRDLNAAIVHLLSYEAITIDEIGAIVVASGPGSFSGLRVGIAEGKGLAFSRDIPLVGIPTLDAIAFQVSPLATDIIAALPAGRGQVYLAHYRGGADFARQSDYQLLPSDEAARGLNDALVAGEAADELVRGGQGRLPPPAFRLRRPGFLAELGERYLAEGGADQRDVLEPLYLRRSAAEEKRAAGG